MPELTPEKASKEQQERSSKLFENFDKTVKEIKFQRKKPFLVMYYPEGTGRIKPEDISALESHFDDFLNKKSKSGFNELDLLIHTHGGEAYTSYRLIQLIRSYCKSLNVLVATHSHSGGTIISFGADTIEMGRSATLSPIDVQLGEQEPFTLLAVEKYIEFLNHNANISKITEEVNRVTYLTELTEKLIQQIGATQLGELFRLRSLTELHARTLLYNYMLKHHSYKERIADRIIAKFTSDSPTHDFLMDFELIKDTGLNVKLMDNKLYKLLKDLIGMLKILENSGIICNFHRGSTNQRLPWFKIFD